MQPGNHIKQFLLSGASVTLMGHGVMAQTVSGTVNDVGSAPLANVRVLLYNSDTSYFN